MPEPVTFVGFDSAWADNPKVPGAICAVDYDGRGFTALAAPHCVGFEAARRLVESHRCPDRPILVGLDQPLIVSNDAGSRPVDRLAASVISWAGGGVQPANRGKTLLFGRDAPVWRFLAALQADIDPLAARSAVTGLFVLEVFPALALLSLDAAFFGRLLAPRYNPARPTFTLKHWRAVVAAASREAAALRCEPATEWLARFAEIAKPRKADQDRLDAVLCLLVAIRWRLSPPDASVMIGDAASGTIVAPASAAMRERLAIRARALCIPLR